MSLTVHDFKTHFPRLWHMVRPQLADNLLNLNVRPQFWTTLDPPLILDNKFKKFSSLNYAKNR